MQQEINLYLLLPEQKKSFLNLRMMAISYGLFLVVLTLQLGFEYWGAHKEREAVATLEVEINKTQDRMAAIHREYPMLELGDIDNSLKKLQQELDEKNNLVNLLSGNKNFSNYLLGASKAAVNGLWLVDIRADLESQDLVLKGYATHSSGIQHFINSLATQEEFQGLNFQLQQVNKVELNKESLLSFIISTKVIPENEI